MNKLILIFFTVCTNLIAQNKMWEKYSGMYVFNSEVYHKIELQKNGLFTYKLRTSFKFPVYYGKWQVKKDKLFLSPFVSVNNKPSYTQNWCEYTSISDSIYIYVHDNNYKPIKCDSIKLWYELNDERWILKTEENKYVVPINYLNESVYITTPNHGGVTVKFKPDKGNCLHVFLPLFEGKFPLTIKVMEINDTVIIMPKGAVLKRIE